jgi:hemoglobin/transferrin/lactoferrin receptor protein
MNNAIYRSGNLHNVLQADVNSIESAEVIFGPGTNIYGSDALGGVIDLHTLNPKLSSTSEWKATGSAMGRLASADFEKTFHVDMNFGNDKWAFLTSISYSDFDDLMMGNIHNDYAQRFNYVTEIDGRDSMVVNSDPNKQLYSGYDQLSFLFKIKQKFSEYVDWTYAFYITQTGDVPRYDRLLEYDGDVLKYAEWYYKPQQWLMNRLELNFNKRNKAFDHLNLTLAYQNVQEGRNDRKYQNDWLRQRTESVNVFSINANFDKEMKWNSFLFYGIEFVYNDVLSEGIEENIYSGEIENVSTRYPDSTNKYLQGGAYLTYKKNFSTTPLSLQAGIRFSYVSLTSTFTEITAQQYNYDNIQFGDGSLTGSAGMTYRPGNWQIRLNLSSGFRAPNLDDMAKIFDSEPGNVVVPNEDLEAEYLYNIDLGFAYKYRGVISAELTTFFSYLDNAMVRRDYQVNGQDSIMYDGELSKVQAIVNVGNATIYGATFVFNAKLFPNLAFNTTLTYIKGLDSDGYAIRHAPPLYGATSFIYELNKLKLAVSANYNAQIAYENLSPSERSKAYLYATDSNGNPYSPGWWTLDFTGSYAFSQAFLVTFGIDNILNYRYRPYSSGITAPGRNFIVALRFSF